MTLPWACPRRISVVCEIWAGRLHVKVWAARDIANLGVHFLHHGCLLLAFDDSECTGLLERTQPPWALALLFAPLTIAYYNKLLLHPLSDNGI